MEPKGGGAKRRPLWGAAEGGALLFFQELLQKSSTNIQRIYQKYNNNKGAAFGGAPRGARFARLPWDLLFLYFWLIFCIFVDDFCSKFCPEKKSVGKNRKSFEDPSIRVVDYIIGPRKVGPKSHV